MSAFIQTERLTLRSWQASDADAALNIYGAPEVRPRLAPTVKEVTTPGAMRSLLDRWRSETAERDGCLGHWAVQRRSDAMLVGGVSLQHAPSAESVTLAWALAPSSWGHGYAAEAGDALLRWAMHEQGVLEVFAIMQPDNARAAATARRIGMEWVRELGHVPHGRYQVYRLRHGDLAWHA